MGHDISLEKKGESIDCFKVAGNGNYKCDENLVPLDKQSNLYITHNNSKMLYLAIKEVGLKIDSFGAYLNGKKAKDIVVDLNKIRKELVNKIDKYKPLEPDNGWGGYEDLCQKLESLMLACIDNPEANLDDCY